jgi:alkylation response protein AidB-like acyl-CoA dehydrogenase
MRLIGMAEVALEKMCRRTLSRRAFGRAVADQTVTQEPIAESRILIVHCNQIAKIELSQYRSPRNQPEDGQTAQA